MASKPLIFDFDGVLGDTYEVAVQALVRCGHFPDEAAARAHVTEYTTTKPNHVRGGVWSDEEIAARNAWVVTLGETIEELGVRLFDDFVEEVKKLDAQIAVVSSGAEVYLVPAMVRSGLAPTHVLGFSDHHSKEEKIERIARDWNVPLSDLFYFTDSLADVYELRNLIAPEKLIGCGWGFCGAEVLARELEAPYILKDPKDIHALF